MKWIIWTMVIVLLAVGGAAAYFVLSDTPLPWQEVESPERVLLIVASEDEAGSVLAQVVAVLDTSAGTVTSVSPDMAVTIPGTTYTELKDAFPFGGPAGVAIVYADASGAEASQVLPYVAIGAAGMEELVDDRGGMTVDLGEDLRVFDGETLYAFDEGSQELTGAMVLALLRGVPYLSAAERESVRKQLGETTAQMLAAYPGGISAAKDAGVVQTDLSDQVLDKLDGALRVFDR